MKIHTAVHRQYDGDGVFVPYALTAIGGVEVIFVTTHYQDDAEKQTK